jgi:hypothetical protein
MRSKGIPARVGVSLGNLPNPSGQLISLQQDRNRDLGNLPERHERRGKTPQVYTEGMSVFTAAGLKWDTLTAWKNEGSGPMRAATYSMPTPAGDRENAECVVYLFGAGQGGPSKPISTAGKASSFRIASPPAPKSANALPMDCP